VVGHIRILLADDHTIARAGMKALLGDSDIEVVAEAADGLQALDLAVTLTPDVAVLDYNMPGLTGAEVAARLRREALAVKALVLSAHEDRAFLRQVLEAGARGYVLKRAAAEELVQAIRVVAAGGMYLDPTLTEHVVEGFVSPPAATAEGGPALTEREEEVLRLVARGYANKEVAARLDVSVKTVESHKLRAMEKLGLDGRVDLVQYAYDHGWLART
jgi:DNA-binding NarL/FixJ family response regulator